MRSCRVYSTKTGTINVPLTNLHRYFMSNTSYEKEGIAKALKGIVHYYKDVLYLTKTTNPLASVSMINSRYPGLLSYEKVKPTSGNEFSYEGNLYKVTINPKAVNPTNPLKGWQDREEYNTHAEVKERLRELQQTEREDIAPLHQVKGQSDLPIKELDNILKSFLTSLGISVEAYDSLKNRMNIDSIAMLDIVNKIILISQDKQNSTTLPHEVGHLIIETLKNSGLVDRAMDLIEKDELYKRVLGDKFDRYNELYKGNITLLKKEALGEVLGNLIKSKFEETQQPKLYSVLKHIWNRFISLFKHDFITDLNRKVNDLFGESIEDILTGNYEKFALKETGEVFFQIDKKDFKELTKEQQAISLAIGKIEQRILEHESMYGKDEKSKEKETWRTLNRLWDEGKYLEGYIEYIKYMENEVIEVNNDIKKLSELKDNVSESSKILRKAKDFVNIHIEILTNIKDDLDEKRINGSSTWSDETYKLLSSVNKILDDLNIAKKQHYKLTAPTLSPFYAQFVGEKRGDVDFVQLFTEADKDISIYDRWLRALSYSSDEALRLVAEAVRVAKDMAIMRTFETKQELLTALMELEKSDVKDTKYLFERNKDGKLTGNILTKWNQADFERDKEAFFETLKKEYHGVGYKEENYDKLTAAEQHEYGVKIHKWYSNNAQSIRDYKYKFDNNRVTKEQFYKFLEEIAKDSEYTVDELATGLVTVPGDKYLNKSFSGMSEAQKKFYDTVMKHKRRLDSYLPFIYREKMKFLVPQLRKDTLEKLKRATSMQEFSQLGKEWTKELFNVTEDEIERGDWRTTKLTDLQGREKKFLPILFTKAIENPDINLSTDIVESMVKYSATTEDYHEMNQIIDVLELSRDAIIERKANVIDYTGKPVKEVFRVLKTVISKNLRKESGATNIKERIDDFFAMMVYGKTRKEQGSFTLPFLNWKLDYGKTLDLLGRYTAINNLAFNVYSGINNVTLGNVLMRIEAFSNQFFNHQDLAYADKIYFTELPGVVGDVGNRIQKNKLQLFIDQFQILQDYESSAFNVDADRRNKFSKLFNISNLFFVNHVGEHQMQSRLALANAHKVRLKDNKGNEVSLYDALEIKDNKLSIKEGYKKLDGTEWNHKDSLQFIGRTRAINQYLNGIYNKLDRNALMQYGEGRLVMMFHKFIVPGIDNRFANKMYIYPLQDWKEGYYLTMHNFLKGLIQDYRKGQFSIAKAWNEIKKDPMKLRNMHKFMAEMAYVASTFALATILANLSGDDDDDWAFNMLAYQVNRLHSELFMYSPVVGLSESIKIINSPSAALNFIEDGIQVFNIIDYFHTVKSGQYEGWNKGLKNIVELSPFVKTTRKFLTPEEQLKYFNSR